MKNKNKDIASNVVWEELPHVTKILISNSLCNTSNLNSAIRDAVNICFLTKNNQII